MWRRDASIGYQDITKPIMETPDRIKLIRKAPNYVIEQLLTLNIQSLVIKAEARNEKERRNKWFVAICTTIAAFVGSFIAGILIWKLTK